MALDREAVATYEESLTGEVTRYVAEIGKARKLLGYQPRVPLTQGIRMYVKWLRECGWL